MCSVQAERESHTPILPYIWEPVHSHKVFSVCRWAIYLHYTTTHHWGECTDLKKMQLWSFTCSKFNLWSGQFFGLIYLNCMKFPRWISRITVCVQSYSRYKLLTLFTPFKPFTEQANTTHDVFNFLPSNYCKFTYVSLISLKIIIVRVWIHICIYNMHCNVFSPAVAVSFTFLGTVGFSVAV